MYFYFLESIAVIYFWQHCSCTVYIAAAIWMLLC